MKNDSTLFVLQSLLRKMQLKKVLCLRQTRRLQNLGPTLSSGLPFSQHLNIQSFYIGIEQTIFRGYVNKMKCFIRTYHIVAVIKGLYRCKGHVSLLDIWNAIRKLAEDTIS